MNVLRLELYWNVEAEPDSYLKGIFNSLEDAKAAIYSEYAENTSVYHVEEYDTLLTYGLLSVYDFSNEDRYPVDPSIISQHLPCCLISANVVEIYHVYDLLIMLPENVQSR